MTDRTDLRSWAAEKLAAVTAHAGGVIGKIIGVSIRFMACVAGLLMLFSRVREFRIVRRGEPQMNADDTDQNV